MLISKGNKYKRISVLVYNEGLNGERSYFWRELKGLFEDIERDFELGLNGRYGLVLWDSIYEKEIRKSGKLGKIVGEILENDFIECKYKVKIFNREDKGEFCSLECMNEEYEDKELGDYSECWCKNRSVEDFVEMLREFLGEGLYENGEIWIKDELGNVVTVDLDRVEMIGWVRIE